ncbi:MAG: DNA gyrase subunit A [Caulobacterales bacterium]|nr:DNA gyrase subunit A [Caulobacterales bacterium]MCA0372918.1 DNA gyrase subunit A [Pseudomonadota bacterium]
MPPNDGGGRPPIEEDGIEPVSIEDELKSSYLDYAMSVIVSRALPDARDGLKPVHRRILYAMYDVGFTPDKKYVKSAQSVGEVMGKYHPHGDSAIYDALVRMAQPFSMSLPLIDGQGNFGSVDGDPPAAMRYTESKLAKTAIPLLDELHENTVDFVDNYDGSYSEPSVLPAKYPNLLVNGAGGIAVGMATNIPPHNLGEVCNAALLLLEQPEATDQEILEIIPGPDFPTGAQIVGRAGARKGLLEGRGSVVMRAKTDVEKIRGDREAIIVHEIPYQVNKASMIEKIAELVRDKRVEGISAIRDESDRRGMRVVIEIKRDATADVVLNQLYRLTPLQTSFGVNMLALVDRLPIQMNVRSMLQVFLRFRETVITNRTRYRLSKARDRGHDLVGLAIAVANIDEVVKLIREAPDPAAARHALTNRDWPAKDLAPLIALIADPRSHLSESNTVRLSEDQARAILDLRLQRLTGLGRDELSNEVNTLAEKIADLLDILRSRARIIAIIKEDLIQIRDSFAVPRRSQFIEADLELGDEDFIEREEMVVTLSHQGYIKRTALSEYRTQNRGGRGRAGMSTKDEDWVVGLFAASTHTPILFFTDKGLVYREKVWRLPQGDPRTKGRSVANILALDKDERISSVLALPEDESTWGELELMFATKKGTVRRNSLTDFQRISRGGKIAMKLQEDEDQIINVAICSPSDDVLLTTKMGQCIRFSATDVRVFKGRDSTGVRGINLANGDEVISMSILKGVEADSSERNAYIKRSRAERGEEASDEVETIETDETANVIGALSDERYAQLKASEQFILAVTDDGFGKRSSSFEYRLTGRGGKGIVAHKLVRKGTSLVAAFAVEDSDDLMMVTDGGQLIRTQVSQIGIKGRATQGVKLIRVGDDEKVVSVERLSETGDDEAAEVVQETNQNSDV